MNLYLTIMSRQAEMAHPHFRLFSKWRLSQYRVTGIVLLVGMAFKFVSSGFYGIRQKSNHPDQEDYSDKDAVIPKVLEPVVFDQLEENLHGKPRTDERDHQADAQ